METDKLNEILKNSKSKNEVLLKFFGYSNKAAYDKLNEYINVNNIDVSHLKKKEKFCLNCGEKINKSVNKFCNKSCAATFNNKKRQSPTELTKLKTSKSLTGRRKNYCSKNDINKVFKPKFSVCVICGKEFEVKRFKKFYSKTTTCSNECHSKLKSIRGKEVMRESIKNGKHKGWNSRNIISYPEKFFIKVLGLNKIKFKHNFPVLKKSLGLDSAYNYFLDFYIEDKRIDLEIDGKQHLDRIEHDDERDGALIRNGYYVYRIKWKNINTESGKKYIKNEIRMFLEFYKNRYI
jgi:very-short-patch-repair endonuclease